MCLCGWMDWCTDGGCCSTKKGKQRQIFIKLCLVCRYWFGTSVTLLVCCHQIAYFHVCSDWLIYQEFCMGCNDETSMWVVVYPNIAHVFCCCQCDYQVSHLHICSEWVITKNANIPSSVFSHMSGSCYILWIQRVLKAWQLDAFCRRPYSTATLNSN